MQAAMLGAKLNYLDQHTAHRRQEVDAYMKDITNYNLTLPLPLETCPLSLPNHVWHLFVIRMPNRDALQQHLAEQDIQSLFHYPIPPHQQQAYRKWGSQHYPLTEAIHQQVLSSTIDPMRSALDVAKVIEVCNQWVE